MRKIPLLKEEMLWQQTLGQTSLVLKMFFANSWNTLSYVNFTMICLVNVLFLNSLIYDEIGVMKNDKSWQKNIVEGVSTIQTSIAFVVMISYYTESRARFEYMIANSNKAESRS
jgi:hypothetical protein